MLFLPLAIKYSCNVNQNQVERFSIHWVFEIVIQNICSLSISGTGPGDSLLQLVDTNVYLLWTYWPTVYAAKSSPDIKISLSIYEN